MTIAPGQIWYHPSLRQHIKIRCIENNNAQCWKVENLNGEWRQPENALFGPNYLSINLTLIAEHYQFIEMDGKTTEGHMSKPIIEDQLLPKSFVGPFGWEHPAPTSPVTMMLRCAECGDHCGHKAHIVYKTRQAGEKQSLSEQENLFNIAAEVKVSVRKMMEYVGRLEKAFMQIGESLGLNEIDLDKIISAIEAKDEIIKLDQVNMVNIGAALGLDENESNFTTIFDILMNCCSEKKCPCGKPAYWQTTCPIGYYCDEHVNGRYPRSRIYGDKK